MLAIRLAGNALFGKKSLPKKQPKLASQNVCVNAIVLVKRAALRRRVWFSALNRVERGILDLTAQYVEHIKSTKLAHVVTAIMEKLQYATESMIDRLARTVGFSLARKVSAAAVSLGNYSAHTWAHDSEFARFLAVTQLNKGVK